MRSVIVIGIATVLASRMLVRVVRTVAIKRGIVDKPNERSSHREPTARGGGAAIVLASLAAFAILGALGVISPRLCVAVLGGGGAVAAVGLADDFSSVSPGRRLLVHIAAAVWAIGWLGGIPAVRIGENLVELGWVGDVLGVVAIVWSLNLFNFMDGIDGLAASEAVFISLGAMVLCGGTSGVAAMAFCLGMASLGFLPANWPPAKIFMGDVGSGYLGYVLAVLAIAGFVESGDSLWIWGILGGVFVIDATVTLLRRAFRGENVSKPHRSHAYQRLARSWGSHLRVTLAVGAVNLLFLLPAAFLATTHPADDWWIASAAMICLLLVVLASGAGVSEESVRSSKGV